MHRLAASSREPRRDAELLLRHVLGRDRAWVLAHPEALMAAPEQRAYAELLERRAQNEPVQYILGEQEFWGLRFRVSPAVLIPRPETEHLVEAVLARMPRDRVMRLVDVGTGSGAIAVALAHELPLLYVTAVDLYPNTLAVAEGNARAHGVEQRVRFLVSDLLQGLGGERFEAVVSNPPYVCEGEQLEAQVQAWEPHGALFAGRDGMAVYRRLVPQAAQVLLPGGLLAMESGVGQARAVRELLRAAGWCEPTTVRDLQGIERVVLAHRL